MDHTKHEIRSYEKLCGKIITAGGWKSKKGLVNADLPKLVRVLRAQQKLLAKMIWDMNRQLEKRGITLRIDLDKLAKAELATLFGTLT